VSSERQLTDSLAQVLGTDVCYSDITFSQLKQLQTSAHLVTAPQCANMSKYLMHAGVTASQVATLLIPIYTVSQKSSHL